MSTLEGAVPLGMGITKLRLWDEFHRTRCDAMQSSTQPSVLSSPTSTREISDTSVYIAHQSSRSELSTALCTLPWQSLSSKIHPAESTESQKTGSTTRAPEYVQQPASRATPWRLALIHPRDSDFPASLSGLYRVDHHRDDFSKFDKSKSTSSWAEVAEYTHGILPPPVPRQPGPSRQKPPPLDVRIKAKARRAKRKRQKAEHRRRLFLAQLVQVTRLARLLNRDTASANSQAAISGTNSSTSKTGAVQKALALFPERLGVDLGNFVEVVFDTDAQSSEITAPSDISDDELARATRTEIETRRQLAGADIKVPGGVFRWMVAKDFARCWPEKVQHVRDNPWPGLEHVWGSPSGEIGAEEALQSCACADQKRCSLFKAKEPVRWQSGHRSRFLRRKERDDANRQPQESAPATAGIARLEKPTVIDEADVEKLKATPAQTSIG